jgi:hypothetical protein
VCSFCHVFVWNLVKLPVDSEQTEAVHIFSSFQHAKVALWYYATKRQVAGSIPDGVTGIFQ